MNLLSLRHPFGLLLAGLSGFAYLYILGPLAIIVASSFGDTGFLAFPPQGFSLRWYASALANRRFLDGFATSLQLAATVTLIATVLGIPASYALARRRLPGSYYIELVLLSPLLLPGLVVALALTILFAHHPLFGTGTWRLVVADLVICIPCVMRVATPNFRRLDPSLEEAALNLGANPLQAFLLVALPSLRPGLLAAAALSFIMAFDEVDMAVFLSSPRNPPITVVLYAMTQTAFDPSLAAVASCLVLSVFAVVGAVQIAKLRR